MAKSSGKISELGRELRPHILWDFIKRGIGMILAFAVAVLVWLKNWPWWLLAMGAVMFVLFSVAFVMVLIDLKRNRTAKAASTLDPTYVIHFKFLPGNLLDNGWTRAYPQDSNEKPQATTASDAPEFGSIVISAPEGHAYDYRLPVNAKLADRMVYVAKHDAGTMIFTQVKLSSKDGMKTDYKWIKYELGKGAPYPTNRHEADEWTFTMPGEPVKNGWRKFEISLPDAVSKTWGTLGFVFIGVTRFRIRGNLGMVLR